MTDQQILASHAATWAETVLRVLRTPWPYGSAHASVGPDDCEVTPTRLHPMFHGSLDWHSSCHMQWSAIQLLTAELSTEEALDEAVRAELISELDARLTIDNGIVEAAYLTERPGYERPYGWGWAVALAALVDRVAASEHPLAADAKRWNAALMPLTEAIAANLTHWLPRLAYPIRHGVHSNTAFALGLARDGFVSLHRHELVAAIDSAATTWFLNDVDYPSRWEPSGADFLSPALTEADLVRRLLPAPEFAAWLNAFLPGLAEPDDVLLATPVVLDPTDGHAVHLFGLALSRAASLRAIAPSLDPVRRERALAAAATQTEFALHDINDGDFMSTHWLVSFALLGLPEALR